MSSDETIEGTDGLMVSPAEQYDRIEDHILMALRESDTVTLSELMQRFVSEGENPDIVREVVWGLLDNSLVHLTSDRKLLLEPGERRAATVS
jgi:hypothetical protein